MKIKEVYQKYNIHPNLVSHMLRVAKVANFILGNWVGPEVDKNKILRLCLVHDLGNIVRMTVDGEHWNKIKSDIIEKYGDEDDIVTIKILTEVGLDEELKNIILEKRFINSIKISESSNWYLKILLYSDLRVLPTKVGTLKERLDEVIPRRPDLSSRPDINLLQEANFEIEKQVQKNVNISLESVDEKTSGISDDELLDIEI